MKAVALLASFSSLAAAICHYGTALNPRADFSRRAEGVFGYNELQGPLNWHGLGPENMLCATGKNQSPINVVAGEIKSVRGSSFGFKAPAYPKGAEFENLGTGVQVYVNGSATVRGKAYSLQQFHFHTPSEHHVGGEYYPMEVHFVFQADGKMASHPWL
jgi:carbonic anhydrase